MLKLLLLLIRLVVEGGFQALVDLLHLLLGFDLVSPDVVLLLEVLPNFKFVYEICEDVVDCLELEIDIVALVNLLQLGLIHAYEEVEWVELLRQRDDSHQE